MEAAVQAAEQRFAPGREARGPGRREGGAAVEDAVVPGHAQGRPSPGGELFSNFRI